jgi:hypothetical protein
MTIAGYLLLAILFWRSCSGALVLAILFWASSRRLNPISVCTDVGELPVAGSGVGIAATSLRTRPPDMHVPVR